MEPYEKLPTYLLCIFNSSITITNFDRLHYITYNTKQLIIDQVFFKYSLFGCDMTADISVTVSGLENSGLHDIYSKIQSSGEKMSLRSEV